MVREWEAYDARLTFDGLDEFQLQQRQSFAKETLSSRSITLAALLLAVINQCLGARTGHFS